MLDAHRRAAVFDLPPELSGALTFHLPMELLALEDAGAPAAVVATRVEERLAEAYRVGMIDPPLYRWAVRRYGPVAASLLADDAGRRTAAFAEVLPLGEGLAGAAFHGLIRLGYGAWARDTAEVARGLAYLRTRRQVLAPICADPAGASPADLDVDLPPPAEREGATVFDLLSLAAGTGEPARLAGETRRRTLRAALQEGLRLVKRNPSSFVAVHALTGFHALCEVHLLVCGEPPHDATFDGAPTSAWWDSFLVAARACALLVESEPPEALAAYDGEHGAVGSVDELVAASTHSDDTHDVKLAVALRRLVGFGLLSEDDAVSAGLHRLAAGQLA